MNNNMYITKISSEGVKDDCFQIMVPYKDNLTIIGPQGLIFHNDSITNTYINTYLTDERKETLPYHTIPTHKEKEGIFSPKINVVNQIMEFQKPYITLMNNGIFERYGIKCGDEVILIEELLTPYIIKSYYATKKELQEIVKKYMKNDSSKLNKYYFRDANQTIAYNSMQLLNRENSYKDAYSHIICVKRNGEIEIITIKAYRNILEDNMIHCSFYGYKVKNYSLDEVLSIYDKKISYENKPKIRKRLNPNLDYFKKVNNK